MESDPILGPHIGRMVMKWKSLEVPFLSITPLDLEVEMRQCEDEGKDVKSLTPIFKRLSKKSLAEPKNLEKAKDLLDRTASLPVRKDFPYKEPSDWEGICAAMGKAPRLPRFSLKDRALEDKIYGAWLGRACGCLLGKPVEGWRTPRLWGYLKDTGCFPLSSYITARAPVKMRKKYELPGAPFPFIENVRFMPEDDDMNYTVAGLALMKKHGCDFSPLDVARFWLEHIPLLRTCTAERVACRNFCHDIAPPQSALYRNPYREWIGAQIRADFFGYACPGKPRRAALLAWRDASISHVKNGIYGEMWAAAMVSAAFATADPVVIIRSGLSQIPIKSRFHEAITEVLDWHRESLSYDEAVKRVHSLWDENIIHHWCHAISNAMIVAIGLLCGEGDYGKSICRAVQPCFDTDCNGATVGSIMGAILGARNLPEKWTKPLNDTLETGVSGYGHVRISDLARQTLGVIEKIH